MSAGFFAAGLICAQADETKLRRIEHAIAPTLALSDLSGRPVDLAEQRGRIVFVHFFATWCEPCREELPALQRLAERSIASARVIAVSVGEPELRVRRFVDAVPMTFPILLDPDRAAARAWRVSDLPTTFVLDRDLTPTLVAENAFAWDTLDPGRLIEHLAARDVRLSGPASVAPDPMKTEREE